MRIHKYSNFIVLYFVVGGTLSQKLRSNNHPLISNKKLPKQHQELHSILQESSEKNSESRVLRKRRRKLFLFSEEEIQQSNQNVISAANEVDNHYQIDYDIGGETKEMLPESFETKPQTSINDHSFAETMGENQQQTNGQNTVVEKNQQTYEQNTIGENQQTYEQNTMAGGNKQTSDRIFELMGDNQQTTANAFDINPTEASTKKYQLTEQVMKWCDPTELPLLPYENCDHEGTFNELNFMAGLTNGLKFMLLQVIASFEANRCFYITEDWNHLIMRDDKSQEMSTFLGRYFEPIGLPRNHTLVLRAQQENRIHKMGWQEVWDDMRLRRIDGYTTTIKSLGYNQLESAYLKRLMLERMWRLLPHVRNEVCSRLETHVGLDKRYLSLSVRRGDKYKENFKFPTVRKYIYSIESILKEHQFESDTIYVATDDCRVMDSFRKAKPEWIFASECDRNETHNGFILTDMRSWTLEQTDEHYYKFFTELFGLVGSWFYIGVSYTNVAWWAFYMRPHKWAHRYIDKGYDNAALDRVVGSW